MGRAGGNRWRGEEAARRRDLEWAIGNFLAHAHDQVPHLRAGSEASALYVGRRLDQAWRALEWHGMRWLELGEVHAALCRDPSRPEALALPPGFETCPDAVRLARAARGCLFAAGSRVAETSLTPGGIAAGLHAARVSFSAYRLGKHAWLDAVGRVNAAAYHWWEA